MIMELINEDIDVNLTDKRLKELIFIYNALDNGWTIKKKNDLYIFSKKHNNKKEIYQNEYLQEFIDSNSVLSDKLIEFKK
jgi:hypothetical protein